MAANPQQSSLSGLARALVQAGRIKEAEATISSLQEKFMNEKKLLSDFYGEIA